MAFMDYVSFDTHDVFDRLRFNMDDISESSTGRIAIVGLTGVGKKALCNSLWGWEAVKESEETSRNFGLITLIDLPLDPYDVAGVLYRLEGVDLVIFVLDAVQGLDPDSFNWIARLRGLNSAMLIALNKIDHLTETDVAEYVAKLETQLARPVVALKTVDPQDVRENLLSAVLKVCPDLATPLAMEITSLRHSVAQNLIMQAMMTGLSISLNGHTRSDVSVLTGLHLRLIRQIAAVFGYKEHAGFRQRLGLTVLLRTALHIVLKQVAHLQRLDNRIGSGVVNIASTFLIGQAAMLFYSAQWPRWLMRQPTHVWRAQDDSASTNEK